MIAELVEHIRAKNLDGVQAILQQGVDVNQPDSAGAPPIIDAVMYGTPEIVALLLAAGASANASETYERSSPLMLAAEEGDCAVARMLLQAGADVTYRGGRKDAALDRAVSGRTQDHLEMVHLLITAGADVNDPAIPPVLVRASGYGSPEIVQAVIHAGAHLDQITVFGTALIEAVAINRADNVAVLLAAGADPSLPAPANAGSAARRGKTPLEIATANGQPTIRRLLQERLGLRAASAASALPAEKDCAAVSQSWQRLERICQAHLPSAEPIFAGPADAEEIACVEDLLGAALPEDFKASYSIHDGQRERTPGLILPHAHTYLPVPRHRFMPIQTVLYSWNSLRAARLDEMLTPRRTACEPGIQPAFWLPGWVPFASNGGSDYLCIDLTPAANGTRGQVIGFNHDQPQRAVLASSFAAFLEMLADALEQGDQYVH